MYNKGLNLRKVAILFVYLAITVVFTNCDKKDNDGDGKRKISAEEQQLVGTWGVYWDGGLVYRFYNDGTYIFYAHFTSFADMRARGFWSLTDGLLKCKAQWGRQTNKDTAGYIEEFGYVWTPWGEFETFEYNIRFGIEDISPSYMGKEYFDILRGSSFDKPMDRFIKDNVGGSVNGM